MKKMNSILRKCKSLSRQLGRSSSYSSLRSSSNSTRGDRRLSRFRYNDEDDRAIENYMEDDGRREDTAMLFVGSSRRRYVINSKYLNHPLLSALIDRSNQQRTLSGPGRYVYEDLSVKCEVVLFDHLLWMLENADPNLITTSDALEELAELYHVV